MWVAHTFRTLRLTPFIYTQIVRAIVWVVTNYLSLPVSVCLLTCSVLRVEPWALCMLSMSPPWAPPQNPNRVIYVLCIPIRTFEWKTMNSKLSVQKWLANSQIFWLLENVTWFASRGTRWENKNTLTGGEYLPKRELNLSVCEHSLFSLCLAFISFSWIWHHGIFWRLSASVLGSIASWFFFFLQCYLASSSYTLHRELSWFTWGIWSFCLSVALWRNWFSSVIGYQDSVPLPNDYRNYMRSLTHDSYLTPSRHKGINRTFLRMF